MALPYAKGCQRIHRRLVRNLDAAQSARRELDRFRGELDETDIEIAALLLTELITNSVKHAGSAAGPYVMFDLTLTGDRVRIEVRDGGPGFVPVPRSVLGESHLHWGMEFVSRLADRWQVVPGSGNGNGNGKAETLVWFELDRGRARAREESAGD